MSFEKHYLTCLFKETDNSSSAEICSAMRNSLVRLHTESLQKFSNTSTNLILEQRIPEYSKLFNDKIEDSILGPIDSLLKGKIHTRHCSAWKSKLGSSNFDASNVVEKPTELSAHCSLNKNLPCKSDVISKADVHILLQKKKQNKEIMQPSNSANVAQSYNPRIQPGGITFFSSPQHNNQGSVNNYENSQNKANECNSLVNGRNVNNIQKTFQYAQAKPVLKPTNNSYQPSNFPRSNSFENAAPRGNQYNSNNQPYNTNNQSYNSKNPYYNSNNPASNSNNINNPPINETVPLHQNSFRTARSELQIQNKKKYGNSNQNYQQIPENNIVKRSLGTTRSSVQSKFVPPLSSGNEAPPMESEEVEDERLKHIDPKMVELIKSEIIDSSAPIGWDDIAGLEFAKTAIQEAVVWPLLRPDIFTGLRRPPKGILLFGPPGTGKTLIGKCIASSCCATFFSISASSLTSKWIGDGEKMVRALFAVARCYQPAVVFIDEIDSLLTQRSDAEHEATRRIKTEFLVQLDGAATGDEDRLLVIGATNRPQELDEAARRRLVKRLYIPLPDVNARQQIVHRLMSSERNSLTEEDMAMVARLADGFSGADMRSLCSEAALGPIRAVPLSQITNIECDQVRPVSVDDFKNALGRVRPSVSGNDLEHYIVWDKTYGSGSQRS